MPIINNGSRHMEVEAKDTEVRNVRKGKHPE